MLTMTYQQIKLQLFKANDEIQAGNMAEAKALIDQVLKSGGTVNDVHSNISTNDFNRLVRWIKKQGK